MFKVIGQTAQNRDPGCKTHWTRPEGPRGLWKFPQMWNEQWGLLTTHCTLFIFLLQVQEAHFWRSYSVPGDASGKESACQCRRHRDLEVQSLGWEDPLEKEMATHSSILAWRIPWTEEPGGLQSKGSQRVRHDWASEHINTHVIFKTIYDKICFISGFC